MTCDELRATLAKRSRRRLEVSGFAESAVLALLLAEGPEPVEAARLVFTVRRADLPRHAGQIAFPGGRRDPDDMDLVATALRETREELGVEGARVEVLGLLDDVPTPSRFVITPVVGVVRGTVPLQPSDGEVAEVFACRLDELRAPERYRDGGRHSWMGIEYVMHEYNVGQHRIWGATARMVYQLLELAGP